MDCAGECGQDMLVVEGMTMQYKGEKKAAVGSARIYWSGFTGADLLERWRRASSITVKSRVEIRDLISPRAQPANTIPPEFN